MKLIVKILIALIPLLVIIGVIRVCILGAQTSAFVPTWEEFLNKFSDMPQNTAVYFKQALDEFMITFNRMQDSFNFQWFNDEATDILQALKQFFDGFGLAMQAIGDFFGMIGGALVFIFKLFLVPINWTVWIFNFLFTI